MTKYYKGNRVKETGQLKWETLVVVGNWDNCNDIRDTRLQIKQHYRFYMEEISASQTQDHRDKHIEGRG